VNSETLQKTLTRLHEELQGSPRVDDESRRLLQQIMQDVRHLPGPETASTDGQQHRLEALAVRFEVDHPTLAATLREFIDLLAQAGI
jgi:Domain of unknown function (DUF4404)